MQLHDGTNRYVSRFHLIAALAERIAEIIVEERR